MNNIEELIKLLHKLDFRAMRYCNANTCICHGLSSTELICNDYVKSTYTLKTQNGIYKVNITDLKLNFVNIDFVLNDGTSENIFVDIKDFRKKINTYSELKMLIIESKIDSIMKMNENILIDKYTIEFKKLLNSLGFILLDTGSIHSDIYILNYNNMHYNITINNIDIEYYNSEKIEIIKFNKITNKRRGLNWHIKSSSIRQAIDEFFIYYPELKNIIRKNKIDKFLISIDES